jgi:hypothetical protein
MMWDIWTDAVAILIASLVIVALTLTLIFFRPAARRQRRHRKRSRRPKIDLFKAEPGESALGGDA